MDDAKEGFILIGTTMIVLLVFLIAVFAVMVIYRKRRIEHLQEIDEINEKFSHELLKTQMEAQRQTMQNIGREIHDNIGQKLTLAVLYVQQLDLRDSEKERVQSIASIINESLRDLRSLSKSLTDAQHMEVDLYQLINNECMKVKGAGITVNFSAHATNVNAPVAIKSFVLRILQEFLQNSLKHSQCSEIDVNLKLEKGGVNISARDNGKGFVFDGTQTYQGIGLANMKKRAEIIHAEFTFESKPGQGTAMQLFIPANILKS